MANRRSPLEAVEMNELEFYRGRRVFVTGHTGFKGAWLCAMLAMAGAEVTGFALSPEEESLWTLAHLTERTHSVYGDIRDPEGLYAAVREARPEIIFHLAAQPIVRESYRDPVGTYHTNVMGTVHILECARQTDSVRSILNVTTDKVYENHQWPWGYRETDVLNGYDPYANSKSCSELVTDSYRRSFLRDKGIAVSTARAGNVIGGGDFAADRIIPDCVRAAREGKSISIRNPYSVRPYQHVLEPLAAYLLIARRQYEDAQYAGSYNVGPENRDCLTTGELADLFCRSWGGGICWEHVGSEGPHEDKVLRLDCSRIRSELGWTPHWQINRAVEETVAWTKAWLDGEDALSVMERQIEIYFNDQSVGGIQ